MSSSTAKTCLEASRVDPVIPHGKRPVVCLNISESRTRNFIRELERRGFVALEFQTGTASSVFRQLWQFIRAARKADFILCGGPLRSQILWLLTAKLLRVPSAVDSPMDCTEWPFATAWHCRWGVRGVLKLADYVLTLKSRAYFVDKFGLREERVLFLENCPDRFRVESSVEEATPRFRPRPNSFLFCCSGCHAAHRLERFMPTFEALLARIPNAELLLIGDPEQATIIESKRYAEANGFADRVHTLPVIRPAEDFFATIAQCHMWVATLADNTLQGRHEFRMELLEVGLLAKPVIAVQTPGLIENGLSDERELIFIDPANPEASAEKIAHYVHDSRLLAELGGRLRACVIERFSLGDAVDHLLRSVSGNHRNQRSSELIESGQSK